MDETNDEILMQQVRDGELDQLTVLFERYSGLLYCFFMKRTHEHSLSEDLTQDVFLKIMKYRKSYKPGSVFRSWLFTIARNAQNQQWSKRFSKLHVLSDDQESETENRADESQQRPDQTANINEESALLYEALEMLPEEKRKLVVLRRIQDLTYTEMAHTLDCEVKSLKVRVHRAVAELAKHLKSLMKERSYELPRMQ